MKRALGLILIGLLVPVLAATSCAKPAAETPPATKTEATQAAPPKLEPGPAGFNVSSLNITPGEITVGSPVTIEVLVANNGELSGTYDVILKIDGTAEATKTVTLAGGASQNVTFTISKTAAKTYAVNISELSGIFVVTAPSPPSAPWVKVSMGYKTTRVRYPSLTYGYSIFHPVEWTVDTSNPVQLQLKTGTGAASGLMSITSSNVTYTSLDDFVNFALSSQERRWQERGGAKTVTSRGFITFTSPYRATSNITASDIIMEIEPGGGKARHVYALHGNQAFTIVAETYKQSWDELSPIFDRVITSFTVIKQ